MEYKKQILANGLRVITVPMPELPSATVTVWVGTGSRFESKKVNGISHFLEHMVFKGGKIYKTAKAISEAVDAIGGEFNAGTSKEWTNFYIRATAKHLEKSFDVLSDMVLFPQIREKDIERERGVIIEEIGMYEDTPMRYIWDLWEQQIFRGNSLGWNTVGTRENIKSIKRDDFVRYRKSYYYAENMVITVAGGVKEQQVSTLVKKYFGKIESKQSFKREFSFVNPKEPKRIRLLTKKTEQANLMLGFLGSRLGEENQYIEEVLESLMGGGMSSRLFTEVREKRGLAYSVKSYVEHCLDTGYFAAYAGVDPKKAKEAIKVILDEHYKLASGKKRVTKKELQKAKEYVKGHFALSLENTRAVNEFFGYEELMLGQLRTPEQVFAGIDKVSVDEIYELARKLFVRSNLNLAIIGPYNNSTDFEGLVK